MYYTNLGPKLTEHRKVLYIDFIKKCFVYIKIGIDYKKPELLLKMISLLEKFFILDLERKSFHSLSITDKSSGGCIVLINAKLIGF